MTPKSAPPIAFLSVVLIAGGSGPAHAACVALTGAGAAHTNPLGQSIDGVTLDNATVSGDAANAGTIDGPGYTTGAINCTNSTITGGITNNGTMSGATRALRRDTRLRARWSAHSRAASATSRFWHAMITLVRSLRQDWLA